MEDSESLKNPKTITVPDDSESALAKVATVRAKKESKRMSRDGKPMHLNSTATAPKSPHMLDSE